MLGEEYARVREYLRGMAIGRVLFAPSDIQRGDRSRNRMQPDLYVVRLDGRVLPAAAREIVL